MTDNSGESFSSTSGLLAGAAPEDAPVQTPALSRLNPSRPRGFRALVRQAAGAEDAVQRSTSQVDSPRIRAIDRSNASMSQASGSPLLGRLGEVSTSNFTEADGIEPQEQSPAKSRYGKYSTKPIACLLLTCTILVYLATIILHFLCFSRIRSSFKLCQLCATISTSSFVIHCAVQRAMPAVHLPHSLKMCQPYAHLSQFADLSPDGRKGSFIGVRRLANEELPAPGADPPPTNEAVAQAVQEKVAVSAAALELTSAYAPVFINKNGVH